MTEPMLVLVRDALLVLLVASVFIVVFWRLTNTTLSLRWEASTKEPEIDEYSRKRLTAERDEARKAAEDLRKSIT